MIWEQDLGMEGGECMVGVDGVTGHLSMEGAGVAGCQLKLEDRWVREKYVVLVEMILRLRLVGWVFI